MQGLIFLKDIIWEEVFSNWRQDEEPRADWQRHLRENNFPDWETWRQYYIKAWNLQNKDWKLYQIQNPLQLTPDFLVGPFSGWQELCKQSGPRFKDIASNFQDHEKVQDLLKNFPKKTQLIGVKVGKKIMLLEGHHRATALAQMKIQNRKAASELWIALYEAEKFPETLPRPQSS